MARGSSEMKKKKQKLFKQRRQKKLAKHKPSDILSIPTREKKNYIYLSGAENKKRNGRQKFFFFFFFLHCTLASRA
jgi:DNA segregation ATPase FtsK/SpoIIIE-like protein